MGLKQSVEESLRKLEDQTIASLDQILDSDDYSTEQKKEVVKVADLFYHMAAETLESGVGTDYTHREMRAKLRERKETYGVYPFR